MHTYRGRLLAKGERERPRRRGARRRLRLEVLRQRALGGLRHRHSTPAEDRGGDSFNGLGRDGHERLDRSFSKVFLGGKVSSIDEHATLAFNTVTHTLLLRSTRGVSLARFAT